MKCPSKVPYPPPYYGLNVNVDGEVEGANPPHIVQSTGGEDYFPCVWPYSAFTSLAHNAVEEIVALEHDSHHSAVLGAYMVMANLHVSVTAKFTETVSVLAFFLVCKHFCTTYSVRVVHRPGPGPGPGPGSAGTMAVLGVTLTSADDPPLPVTASMLLSCVGSLVVGLGR